MSVTVAARVAEHAPSLLVYLDHTLTVRFVSRHARALLGRSPDALVGRALAELVDPGTLRYARLHAAELERGNLEPRDYVLLDGRGARRVLLVHAVADRDAQGRSVGYFASTCDTALLRDMRRELHEARAGLDRILETALALAAEVDQRRRLDRERTRLLLQLAHELHAVVIGGGGEPPFAKRGDGAP